MRIIAGKYKGKQIQAAKDQSIRPTTNRIKEYIFNLLGEFVLEAEVLDLFCGSGSLGIEALSRGAKGATFVDNSQNSLRVLRRNLNQNNIEEPYRVQRKDVLKFITNNAHTFDLIFADPPFDWGDFNKLVPAAFERGSISDFGILIVESEKSHDLPTEGESFQTLRQKSFDRSVITFYTRKEVV